MPLPTFAKRTRPFTSPHFLTELQADARDLRLSFAATRKEEIAKLIKSAPPEDKDEFYWTMIYDLEMAPTTTGRAQILEFGIVPTPPQELATYVDLHDELWTVIEALSRCGIYLLNTDHLNDTDLYARLYYKILDEPCKMMPPEADCAEYIECLHPMDMSFARAHLLSARGTVAPRMQDNLYQRSPVCQQMTGLVDRDSYLPARI